MTIRKQLIILAFIMAAATKPEDISSTVDESREGTGLHQAAATEGPPQEVVIEAPRSAATTVAEPSKRRRRDSGTASSSESEPAAGPVWQVGSDSGWDNAIWWKDCTEPFQAALEAQYQAKRRKVTHECTHPNGRKVLFKHNLTRMLQTNQGNGVTKMLRRIDSISPPLL